MATQKSAKYRFRWSNGTYHSRPERKPKPGLGTAKPGNTQTYNAGPTTGAGGMTVKPGQPPKAGLVPKNPAPVQPEDPNVLNAQAIGQRNVAVGDLTAAFQQGNLDQSYGFGAGGAADPYSQANLLQENYRRSTRGTTNNYAASGQLYSGAYNRAQNENTRNYDIGYDQLRRAYDQASGNIQLGRLQTYANAGTAIDDAKFKALIQALAGLGG